ncbi:MAG: hypothetical protein SFZ24_12615 [Planctomycetota bacterium]|nr:hypothetical protein [Planctomycetota bacterium]
MRDDAPKIQTPSAPTPEPAAPPTGLRGPLFRLDPGWLFIVAGAALLASTVLIPALDDLSEARFQRDRALAVEQYRKERLDNYAAYLDALRAGDPTLVQSLAASQLNLAPDGKMVMLDASQPGLPRADVFGPLEPRLVHPPRPPRPHSILQRWATDERRRVWLLAAGMLSIVIGLLPASARRRAPSEL